MIQHDLFEVEGGQVTGVELIGQVQDGLPVGGDVADDADLDPGVPFSAVIPPPICIPPGYAARAPIACFFVAS